MLVSIFGPPRGRNASQRILQIAPVSVAGGMPTVITLCAPRRKRASVCGACRSACRENSTAPTFGLRERLSKMSSTAWAPCCLIQGLALSTVTNTEPGRSSQIFVRSVTQYSGGCASVPEMQYRSPSAACGAPASPPSLLQRDQQPNASEWQSTITCRVPQPPGACPTELGSRSTQIDTME